MALGGAVVGSLVALLVVTTRSMQRRQKTWPQGVMAVRSPSPSGLVAQRQIGHSASAAADMADLSESRRCHGEPAAHGPKLRSTLLPRRTDRI